MEPITGSFRSCMLYKSCQQFQNFALHMKRTAKFHGCDEMQAEWIHFVLYILTRMTLDSHCQRAAVKLIWLPHIPECNVHKNKHFHKGAGEMPSSGRPKQTRHSTNAISFTLLLQISVCTTACTYVLWHFLFILFKAHLNFQFKSSKYDPGASTQ